jgi:hypothetical protein
MNIKIYEYTLNSKPMRQEPTLQDYLRGTGTVSVRVPFARQLPENPQGKNLAQALMQFAEEITDLATIVAAQQKCGIISDFQFTPADNTTEDEIKESITAFYTNRGYVSTSPDQYQKGTSNILVNITRFNNEYWITEWQSRAPTRIPLPDQLWPCSN